MEPAKLYSSTTQTKKYVVISIWHETKEKKSTKAADHHAQALGNHYNCIRTFIVNNPLFYRLHHSGESYLTFLNISKEKNIYFFTKSAHGFYLNFFDEALAIKKNIEDFVHSKANVNQVSSHMYQAPLKAMISIPRGTEAYTLLDFSMRNKKERRLFKAKT